MNILESSVKPTDKYLNDLTPTKLTRLAFELNNEWKTLGKGNF